MNKRLFTLPLIGILAFGLAALVLFAAGSVKAQATPGDLEIQATPPSPAAPGKPASPADVIHGFETALPEAPLSGGDWDGYRINNPRVISDTGIFRMWYSGLNPENPGSGWTVGMATSEDGLTWTKYASNPVFTPGTPDAWDDWYRGQAAFLKEASFYRMWFSGASSDGPWQTGFANSGNGINWAFYPGNPVLLPGGPGAWDEAEADGPTVIKDGATYKMWYHGCTAGYTTCSIGYATSANVTGWAKQGLVLAAGGPGDWDEGFVFSPQVVKDASGYKMWYTGCTPGFSSCAIGYATSDDGIAWEKHPGNPVLTQGWDDAGIGGFSVVLDGDLYKMWFQSGSGASEGIGYAWSEDGIVWNLHPGNPVLVGGTAGVTMDVNYSHDWVSAWTEPGEPFQLTVSDGDGVKATQTGVANDEGWFNSWDEDHPWTPGQPDILPGDTILGEIASASASVDPVGSIEAVVDGDAETVSGSIHAPWFGSTPLSVRCEVWVENGPPGIDVSDVAPDGGTFTCDFSGDWDIQPGQDIGVMYVEPDGDRVMGVFGVPWMRVNYGHDWVGGNYPAGHTLWITVTNSLDEPKAYAEVSSSLSGGWGTEGFETRWEDWSSPLPDVQQPDIQPGDWVYIKSDDGYTNTVQVGEIDTVVDANDDTISGNLFAPWFDPTPLDMRCEVWVENAPDGIDVSGVDPDGGSFSCDYTGMWDIIAGQDIAVQYIEPDGDRVMGVFSAPWVRINYGHDWVGGNYPVGHTFWITVTNGLDELEAFAEVQSRPGFGWGAGSEGFETFGEDWQPRQPDISPGDWVYFTSDDGYSNAVRVGEITGNVDVGDNSVSGLVFAEWFSEDLLVECHPWGAPGGVEGKSDLAAPDGSSPYLCQWPVDEWDILAGQEIGVMYVEPDGDRVINPAHAPAPNLSISTWTDGSPTAGGNMDFYVEYWNGGDVLAADTQITATLQGMSYVDDSLPVDPIITSLPDGEYAVWDLGDLPPDNLYHRFHLFTQVTASVSDTVTNTVQIGTSTVYGNWDEGQRQNTWSGHVEENNTHINVGKWPWTGDPTPGEDFVWVVNPCNFGSTGSTELQLVDTLPVTTTLVTWWSQHPGWTEIYSDAHTLEIERPSLSGNRCSEVYLRVHVDASTPPVTQLTNHVEIAASNDLETDDNAASSEVWTGIPRNNLWVDVGWNWGRLVPGGEIRYNINYGNGGNMPLTGPVLITETLPANTAFVAAWRNDDTEQSLVTPILETDEYVVWQIDELDAGYAGNFEVVLDIDMDAQPGDTLVNRAEISPVEDEERYDDNVSEWVETVHGNGPNLRVRKEGDWHGHGEGHNAWFNIIFENVGDVGVAQATITDTLPVPMTLAGDPGTDWSRVVSYTRSPDDDWFSMVFQDVHANFRRDINFDAQIEDPDPVSYGLLFTNNAEVMLIPEDTDPGDNHAQVTLATGPDLYVEKSLVAGDLFPGEVITMSLRFGNDQPGHAWWWQLAGNAVLTDTLPAGLEFLHSEQRFCEDTNWCEQTPVEDGNKLTWELWQLWPSEWNEIYLTLRIDDNILRGDLTNLVEIASSTPEVDIEAYVDNNTASLELFIDAPYKLFLPVLEK